ncbi:MAG: YbjQ family protein [Gaiellaceae bacterium]
MAEERTGTEPRPRTVGQFPITTALEFTEWPTEQTLGMVYGVIVRSAGLGRNIIAFFRNLAGGEVKQYTRLVEDGRRHALDRMIENAEVVGADGIVSMRFDSSEMGQSMTEIVAYGTAVRLRFAADEGQRPMA